MGSLIRAILEWIFRELGMSIEQVRAARKDGLLIVTLANPDGNRMNLAVLRGLQEALAQARKPDVRAVLVRAEGPVFSLGADVQEMLSQPGDVMLSVVGEYVELIQAIEALPLPTIAAVHGVCSSGGLELALAFDHLWAAAGTKIGFLEPLLAIFPLAGGVQRVASRAGRARAFEIATAGALYDVETFEMWNIVNRILAVDNFAGESEAFAIRLAAGPSKAFDAVKAILRTWDREGVTAADHTTLQMVSPVMESNDATVAIKSFVVNGPSRSPRVFSGA
jgi:enoyl-CoA hydratase/carnithine racemase